MKKFLFSAVLIAAPTLARAGYAPVQFLEWRQSQTGSSLETNEQCAAPPVNLVPAETSQQSLMSKAIDAIAQGVLNNTISMEDALATMTYNRLSPELLAKAFFFLLPKNKDRTVDMNLFPIELLPYFTGISVQDLIDHGKLPPIEEYEFNNGHAGYFLELSDMYINDLAGISNIPHVTSLFLRNNLITYIQPGTFNDLKNLEELDFRNNRITNLQPYTFAGLTNLHTLYLERNHITNINPRAFAELPRLRVLNLNLNRLTHIVSGTFNNLSNLQELNLSNNPITNIEPGAFTDSFINANHMNLISLGRTLIPEEERARITTELGAINPNISIYW